MGLLRENALAVEAAKNERRALAEAAVKEAAKNREEEIASRDAIKEAAVKRSEDFYAYKNDVKKVIVTEALKRIYMGSITNPSLNERYIGEALIGNYISEKTVDYVMESFRRANTGFLTDLYEACQAYYESETENADQNNQMTMTISRSNAKEVIDKLFDNEDIEDITNTIRMRVSAAEEEFVNKNQRDNANIKTILDDVSKRIADAKMNNDNDYAEVIASSESAIAKDKIYKIQHESKRNVFGQMVIQLSEATLKNPELREKYTAEAGRLDMDAIVESVRCMYTLLEMVNTLKLEVVDEKYLKETIDSIK